MVYFEIYFVDVIVGKVFYGVFYGWIFNVMSGGEEIDY